MDVLLNKKDAWTWQCMKKPPNFPTDFISENRYTIMSGISNSVPAGIKTAPSFVRVIS